MGGGGQLTEPVDTSACGGRAASVYTWDEVQKHCHRNDQWLVINRKVYNVTQWAKRHPGGLRVISHYAGEDATVTTASIIGAFPLAQPSLRLLLLTHTEEAVLLRSARHLTVSTKGIFRCSTLYYRSHSIRLTRPLS